MATESGDPRKLWILDSMSGTAGPGVAGASPHEPSPVEKAALRREALRRRAAAAGTRDDVAAALAGHVIELATRLRAATVAAYVGVGEEPPTIPALDALRDATITVLLPVTTADERGPALAWAAYEGERRLRAGRFGLREPTGDVLDDALETADLVLVPALLVERSGVRLGRGGGYYDRTLASVRAPTYAVVYDDEVVDALPHEPHDVPVLGAVTPGGVVEFRPEVVRGRG
jgi:5-formyltetrahydrofolate cyclo-ligase